MCDGTSGSGQASGLSGLLSGLGQAPGLSGARCLPGLGQASGLSGARCPDSSGAWTPARTLRARGPSPPGSRRARGPSGAAPLPGAPCPGWDRPLACQVPVPDARVGTGLWPVRFTASRASKRSHERIRSSTGQTQEYREQSGHRRQGFRTTYEAFSSNSPPAQTALSCPPRVHTGGLRPNRRQSSPAMNDRQLWAMASRVVGATGKTTTCTWSSMTTHANR